MTARPLCLALILLLGVLSTPSRLCAASLRLRVLDAADGARLAGAAVALSPGSPCARSDLRGEVRLEDLPPGRLRVWVSLPGYLPRELELPVEEAQAPWLAVALEPVRLRLPGVVVTGDPQGRGRVLSLPADRAAALRTPAAQLERLPGLVLREGAGGRLEAGLRGARPDQLLVKLDGVPLNPASGEAVDLSSLDWSRIRRVELKPDGARPGGELLLATSPPDSLARGRVAGRAGAFGLVEAEVEGSGSWAGGIWRLALSGGEADNDFPYLDEQDRELRRVNQGRRRLAGSAEAALPAGRLRLELARDRQGLPGPLYQPPTPEARQEGLRQALFFQRDVRQGSGWEAWWRQELRLLDSPARQWHPVERAWLERVPFALRSRERQAGLAWRGSRREMLLEARLVHHDYRQLDELRADPLSGTARRLQLGLDASSDRRLSGGAFRLGWALGAEGLRDHHASSRQLRLLGHAHLELERPWAWGAAQGAAFAGLSHSRQAPSFRPLFLAESAFTQGNPDLKPERQSGAHLGAWLSLSAGGWDSRLRAEAWLRRYQDGIIWRRNYRGQYLPVNLSRSAGLGADLGASLARGPWSLEASLTAQRLENQDAGSPYEGLWLPFQPEWLGRLALGRETPGGGILASWTLRGHSYGSESNLDPQGVAGVGLPAWSRLDLGLWRRWRWGGAILRAEAGLANLLDEEIETVDGMPQAGRSWKAGVEISR